MTTLSKVHSTDFIFAVSQLNYQQVQAEMDFYSQEIKLHTLPSLPLSRKSPEQTAGALEHKSRLCLVCCVDKYYPNTNPRTAGGTRGRSPPYQGEAGSEFHPSRADSRKYSRDQPSPNLCYLTRPHLIWGLAALPHFQAAFPVTPPQSAPYQLQLPCPRCQVALPVLSVPPCSVDATRASST